MKRIKSILTQKIVCEGTMVNCPDCQRDVAEIRNKWKFSHFDVEAFSCECGGRFRIYKKSGKVSFKLKKVRNTNHWTKYDD